jgi:hypothetical protein
MRIVVNHLTRMDAPRICIAGLDPATGQHVRPVTERAAPLTRSLLCEEGGELDLGILLDLGELTPTPSPPETEDHLLRSRRPHALGQVSPNRYLELLRQHAHESIHAIFGPDLIRHSWNYAVDRNRGSCSLGILRLRRRAGLEVDRYGKLRLKLAIEHKTAFLPVTDVRFVAADHRTIKTDVVADVAARMHRGVEVLLMVGLSREFAKPGDDHERHWLQVNGICLADRPLGAAP